MAGKDIFKYSLKRSQKVKTLPTRRFVTLSSEEEFTLVSDLLFQRLVVFANGCNISFDDCKGYEL